MRTQRDEGAVLIWVALMMTVLLGVGAIVIDVGALYAEKRQLQNGADAASLAVAQDCANGSCAGYATRADQYADLNAKDGASNVDLVCGKGPGLPACAGAAPPGAANATGWVKVTTSTATSGGGNEVDFVLGPFISSLTGATVHATAISAYGPIGSAATLPFIISECEFQQMGGNVQTGTFPTGTAYIFSKRNNPNTYDPPCTVASNGGTAPGNFAWLQTVNGECKVTVTQGGTVAGDPGNDPNPIRQICGVASVQNQEVLLPLYNKVVENGNNTTYTVAGFVGFRITGYQLSGATWPTGFSCPPPLGSTATGGNLRCFRGEFTRVVDAGDFGTGLNFGASAVKMVG